MIKRISLCLSMLLASLSISGLAEARPYQCFQGIGKRKFDEAFYERTRELNDKWRYRYGADCGYQVDFENVYGNAFFEERGPVIRLCKNAGINAATTKVLDDISRKCRADGIAFGAQDGYNFAVEYCSGSIRYGYSLGDFEFSYEESCRDVFIRFASFACPQKKAQDYRFYQKVDAKCNL